eukprot:GDKK01013534.1.p2 GENE.GDKK01013534.1~~GDKK01013534.1.p2  ORF type:complete len:134 (-),score=8.79 GDKK01013534.1:184-585(-)
MGTENLTSVGAESMGAMMSEESPERRGDSESSRSFGSAGTTPSTANACSSISQDSATQPAKPAAASRSSSNNIKSKERHVYDPVYGVILQETRDLWHAQEEDSQHRQRALLDAFSSGEKTIPPVRFSTRDVVS